MSLTTAELNAVADLVASDVVSISLHSGDPGAAGTSNELTGGSPAYARKTPSWSAASGGIAALSAALTFDVPASASVAWIGLWDTGPTFVGRFQLSATESYTAQGTYQLTAASITAT